MIKHVFILSILLVSLASVAEEKPYYWVELTGGQANVGSFDSKIDLEAPHRAGMFDIGFGWTPLSSLKRSKDPAILKWLKDAEVSLGFTGLASDSTYPEPIIYTTLSEDYAKENCYGSYGQLRGGCVPCVDPHDKGKLCVRHNIRGGDAYIKSEYGSLAIGFYVPIKFGRLSLRPGVITRLHLIEDVGRSGGDTVASNTASHSLVLKSRFAIVEDETTHVNNFGIGFNVEKSFAGSQKYGQVTGGLTFGW
jgi:hypothetical protein